MPKSEQQIQKQISDYLQSLPNTYVFKVITANKAGTPDLIVCHNSIFYAFEIKKPGGTVAPLQLHTQQLIQSAGGKAYIVYSLDEVKLIFQPITQKDI